MSSGYPYPTWRACDGWLAKAWSATEALVASQVHLLPPDSLRQLQTLHTGRLNRTLRGCASAAMTPSREGTTTAQQTCTTGYCSLYRHSKYLVLKSSGLHSSALAQYGLLMP